MAQASSLLSVYLTAYYALVHMARIKKGMSCLVHSGMGGVVCLILYFKCVFLLLIQGLATIALAKHFGFEIHATAGTEAKRKKLLEIGCKGVYDSHSFTWASELLENTQGRGVDVVLNSLYGAHIHIIIFY